MSNKYPCVYYDNGKCQKFSDEKYNSWCDFELCEHRTPSNADHIRSMTDEELAFLVRRGVCEIIPASGAHCEYTTCKDCVLSWLKQSYKEDT